jgi:hypothetical protein
MLADCLAAAACLWRTNGVDENPFCIERPVDGLECSEPASDAMSPAASPFQKKTFLAAGQHHGLI